MAKSMFRANFDGTGMCRGGRGVSDRSEYQTGARVFCPVASAVIKPGAGASAESGLENGVGLQ